MIKNEEAKVTCKCANLFVLKGFMPFLCLMESHIRQNHTNININRIRDVENVRK